MEDKLEEYRKERDLIINETGEFDEEDFVKSVISRDVNKLSFLPLISEEYILQISLLFVKFTKWSDNVLLYPSPE